MPKPGFTTITAARIQDASGEPLASGRVTFYPVSSTGGPVSAIAGFNNRGVWSSSNAYAVNDVVSVGAAMYYATAAIAAGGSSPPTTNWTVFSGGGGAILQSGVIFLVVAGAITTDLFGNTAQVADTTLTTPANIAYRVTITDAAGVDVQGPGYGLVQPSGLTWSLDSYVPVQPLNVTVQAGPTGPQGPPGPAGSGNGTLVANASGTPFVLGITGGELSVTSTAPVLIDSVTGQLWLLGVTLGTDGVNRPSFTLVTGAAYAAVAVASIQFYDPIALRARTLTMASGHYVIT